MRGQVQNPLTMQPVELAFHPEQHLADRAIFKPCRLSRADLKGVHEHEMLSAVIAFGILALLCGVNMIADSPDFKNCSTAFLCYWRGLPEVAAVLLDTAFCTAFFLLLARNTQLTESLGWRTVWNPRADLEFHEQSFASCMYWILCPLQWNCNGITLTMVQRHAQWHQDSSSTIRVNLFEAVGSQMTAPMALRLLKYNGLFYNWSPSQPVPR